MSYPVSEIDLEELENGVESVALVLRPDGSVEPSHPFTPDHVATCGRCQDEAGW